MIAVPGETRRHNHHQWRRIMKRTLIILLNIAVFLSFTMWAALAHAANIKSSDVEGLPKVYCKVLKEPDPILLGGWQCIWPRFIAKRSETDTNPVEFWLIKRDGRYALYFYRTKDSGRDKKYIGWKNWKINGNEIVSETGVRLFTEGGEVFFQWHYDKPIKMSPIEGSR